MIASLTQKNETRLFRLELSSTKICKFRKYDVRLMVNKSWRLSNRVSEIAILKALLSARCCCFGSFENISCPKCNAQSVVTLTATSDSQEIKVDQGEYEVYSCQITSNCSSSRDHLKSSVVLIVNGPPFPTPIVSQQFSLLSREKATLKRGPPSVLGSTTASSTGTTITPATKQRRTSEDGGMPRVLPHFHPLDQTFPVTVHGPPDDTEGRKSRQMDFGSVLASAAASATVAGAPATTTTTTSTSSATPLQTSTPFTPLQMNQATPTLMPTQSTDVSSIINTTYYGEQPSTQQQQQVEEQQQPEQQEQQQQQQQEQQQQQQSEQQGQTQGEPQLQEAGGLNKDSNYEAVGFLISAASGRERPFEYSSNGYNYSNFGKYAVDAIPGISTPLAGQNSPGGRGAQQAADMLCSGSAAATSRSPQAVMSLTPSSSAEFRSPAAPGVSTPLPQMLPPVSNPRPAVMVAPELGIGACAPGPVPVLTSPQQLGEMPVSANVYGTTISAAATCGSVTIGVAGNDNGNAGGCENCGGNGLEYVGNGNNIAGDGNGNGNGKNIVVVVNSNCNCNCGPCNCTCGCDECKCSHINGANANNAAAVADAASAETGFVEGSASGDDGGFFNMNDDEDYTYLLPEGFVANIIQNYWPSCSLDYPGFDPAEIGDPDGAPSPCDCL